MAARQASRSRSRKVSPACSEAGRRVIVEFAEDGALRCIFHDDVAGVPARLVISSSVSYFTVHRKRPRSSADGNGSIPDSHRPTASGIAVKQLGRARNARSRLSRYQQSLAGATGMRYRRITCRVGAQWRHRKSRQMTAALSEIRSARRVGEDPRSAFSGRRPCGCRR